MIYSTPHWSNLDLGDTLVHRLVESGIVPTAFHLQDGWWYRLLFFFSFLLKRSSLSDGSEWLWWHHFINQTTPSEVLLPFYRMSPVDVAVWCSSTDILGLDQACCPVWLLKHYCYRGRALGGLAGAGTDTHWSYVSRRVLFSKTEVERQTQSCRPRCYLSSVIVFRDNKQQ